MDTAETDAFIYVREVEDPRSFGVVTLNGNGHITRFVEKPDTVDNRLAVVGLYYFRHGDVLLKAIGRLMQNGVRTNNEFFLADAMQLMVEDGNVFKTRPVWAWLDCGRPETVLETNRYLLGHGHDNSGSFKNRTSAIIIPPVNIDASAQIEESVIGPFVTIAANAVISRCLMRDTIIDEGATCRDMLLEQSLVGRSANVIGRFRSLNVGDSSSIGYVG
jgi:glucose-1-phosphate thymidylyltransferase